jgi:hypothetical protein
MFERNVMTYKSEIENLIQKSFTSQCIRFNVLLDLLLENIQDSSEYKGCMRKENTVNKSGRFVFEIFELSKDVYIM